MLTTLARWYKSYLGAQHHHIIRITRGSHITYYSLMFFIAYAFEGQVHVFAGWVKIVSHSSCGTVYNIEIFLSPATICRYDVALPIMYIYVVLCFSKVKYVIVYLVFCKWKLHLWNKMKSNVDLFIGFCLSTSHIKGHNCYTCVIRYVAISGRLISALQCIKFFFNESKL